MGPLLFIIYTNDIINCSTHFHPVIYADDTTLINTSINLNNDQNVVILNQELDKIYQWLNTNKLSLNISKTKFIIFAPKNKKVNNPLITINNLRINRVSDFNFLGVVVNEKLSWKSHINKVSIKIMKIIGLLHRIKHYVPCEILKLLYCSLVLPHSKYGILYEAQKLLNYLSYRKKPFV